MANKTPFGQHDMARGPNGAPMACHSAARSQHLQSEHVWNFSGAHGNFFLLSDGILKDEMQGIAGRIGTC